ncbi:hypothetical protein Tco_0624082 [Tanacetum coccineum]|uniref:Retrotransposon protein, putative, Ty1-copia subclass n=1 Tax=Tanacetum coccineum TaxID=301880 RepID=A0ABQ4WCX5_9ASTR
MNMMRSLMKILQPLPLSFWDYALESRKNTHSQYGSNKEGRKTPYETEDTQKDTMGYLFLLPPENKIVVCKRYKIDNSKRVISPCKKTDLNKSQGAQTPKELNRMKNVPYASAVGSIMYAVRCTRPDVAFAQNITSRFQQNPGELHWTAVKNILKYLRNTKDMFLVYSRNPEAELRVNCYCNTGFEIDIDDMKSLTGYVSF